MRDGASRAGVLARNSLANLVRVASTSLVALLLPVLLVAILRPDLYAVWALLFGLAGFVLYLDFGLPASVQTLVSRATAAQDANEARARGVSGIRWALVIGGGMLLGLVGAGAAAPALFPALPRTGNGVIVSVVLVVGLGNIGTFVGNTASAYFAGLQRSSVAAMTLVPGRIASLILALIAAVTSQDLLTVALAYAAPLAVGAVVMVAQVLRVPRAESTSHPTWAERLLVVKFSGPLAAWSVYMLCISGVGILVVGRVDFRAVALFSLATAAAAALTGVQSALISPVLSELGRTHDDRARFTGITLTGSRINVAFVVVGIAGVEALYLIAAPFIGAAQGVPGVEAALIFACIVLAAGVRLTMSPLTYAFVASGAHRRLLLPPLGEAGLTLGATIALGAAFGAAGVAVGLLVGACGGVVIALAWSHRVTGVVAVRARVLAVAAVLRPAAALLPAEFTYAVVAMSAPPAPAVGFVVGAWMVLITAVLAWRVCLPRDVRLGSYTAVVRRLPRSAAAAGS